MELRRCSHVCRKDQIKKHLEAKRHVFNVEQAADPNFPKILTDNYKIRTLERLRQLVLEHTAQAVIKLGISLNKGSQQDLWTFCAEMIRIGQSFAAERMDVNEAMVSFARTILTEKVLEIGRRLKMRDMESVHEARFVNIAVDAGTVLGKSVVHAILTNPYSDRFPILLEISDNDGFDKFKYKQLFGILTMQCKKEQLTVCSIITDGLPAQKGALEELISDSEDEYVRSIVPIHCLAHVTQLVFVDIVKQSPYLKCVIGEIQELVRELRKPRIVRELGEKCPDLCQTRWLYIVDVLIWIYAREDKLNVFLLASDNNETQWKQLPLEWKQVMTILLPLKRLSLSMESSECALWEVIPILESTMAAWRKVFHLLSDDGLELLKLAVTNLIRRFSRVVPSAISASFALSELGREVLRRREEGFQTRGTGHRCYTTERIMAAEALFDDVENDISTTSLAALIRTTQGEKDEKENVESALPDDEELHVDDGMLPDTEGDEGDPGTGEEFMLLDLDRLLAWDIFSFNYSTATDEIMRMGEILQIEPEYLRGKMRIWTFEPREETPTCHDICQSPNTIWRRVPANCEDWRLFAEVALRFVTMSTSEADCERMLSRQRDIQGIRTSNIRTELLDARLRT